MLDVCPSAKTSVAVMNGKNFCTGFCMANWQHQERDIILLKLMGRSDLPALELD